MNTPEDQIRALLTEAARMPTTNGQFEVLAEAVRLADLHNDVPLGVAARLPLISAAGNLLRGDEMAVAFTWCLHQFDSRPDLFDGWNLFWEYGTLIGRLANFDTVSRSQLLDMTDDFAARLARAGLPPGPALVARVALAPDLGDRELATATFAEIARRRLATSLRAADHFQHLAFVGDEAAALRLAEAEILTSPRNVFDMHWYDLLALLIRAGRWADAGKWLTRAERQVSIKDTYYWPFGDVVSAMAVLGRLDAAVTMCGQCHRAIREHTDPLTRLHFCADMGVLFDKLLAAGREAVLVRFGDGMPGRRPNGKYGVAEVRDWLAAEAADLAARFDRRNGNDFFADRLRERAAFARLAPPT